jgi:hypothetical protein
MQRLLTTTSPTHEYMFVPTMLSFSAHFFFRLKKQYRAANKCIGKTGAGLKPEDVRPDSEIANIIGMFDLYILLCFFV